MEIVDESNADHNDGEVVLAGHTKRAKSTTERRPQALLSPRLRSCLPIPTRPRKTPAPAPQHAASDAWPSRRRGTPPATASRPRVPAWAWRWSPSRASVRVAKPPRCRAAERAARRRRSAAVCAKLQSNVPASLDRRRAAQARSTPDLKSLGLPHRSAGCGCPALCGAACSGTSPLSARDAPSRGAPCQLAPVYAGLRRTMPDVKPAAAAAIVAKAAAGDSPSPASTPAPAPVAANSNGTPQKPPIPAAAFDMPKPNLRGLNKPKCIQCGNVARSRCPFQCCKSCCYKAQNPCHIHVLKQTNTLPDKPPATAPATEQPSTNLPATSSASRLAALQKLPQHFLKSLQAKKSLTKKDVVGINKWRFMKLKEHMQGDIDAENEAYERYTQNVVLLEETFCPMEDADVEPEAEATSEERMDLLVSEAKVRLKSDNETADSFKERIANILDQKLKKLLENQSTNEDDKTSDPNLDDHPSPMKFSTKQKMERTVKLNELLGKLTRARSEGDLKPCRDLIEQLFGKENGSSMEKPDRMETEPGNQEPTSAVARSYSIPKLCTRMEVDEDFGSKIDDEFSLLSQVVQL